MNAIGSTEAGQSFSLSCTVTTATLLSVRPSVVWVKIENGAMNPVMSNTMTTPSNTNITLQFSSLTFSQRGIYRCVVDLNISSVTEFSITQDYNLIVNCENFILT